MEFWKSVYIREHLDILIEITKYSPDLLKSFAQKELINPDELDEIIQLPTETKGRRFYEMIMRPEALEHLKNALYEDNQYHVTRVLDMCRGPTALVTLNLIKFDENIVVCSPYMHVEMFEGKIMETNEKALVSKIYCENIWHPRIHENVERIRKLQHPNLFCYYDVELCSNRCIVVASDLCNYSLQHCVEDKFYPIDRLEILIQATNGLQYLHDNHIVHRDLRPACIMICLETKIVKLFYTGINASVDIAGNPGRKISRNETYALTFWVGREVLQTIDNLPLDELNVFTPKTDIFSLGCIFYYTFTCGYHPFEIDGVARCGKNILDGKIRSDNVFKKMNKKLEHLTMDMISSDTSHRPDCVSVLHRINEFILHSVRQLITVPIQDVQDDAAEVLSRLPGVTPISLKQVLSTARLLEEDEDEFWNISEYVRNGEADEYGLEICNIVKLYRVGETPFSKIPEARNTYRLMLWHGTKQARVAEILLNGFQLPKCSGILIPGSPALYFNDRIRKSFNYILENRNPAPGSKVFVFLCDVLLGTMYSYHTIKSKTGPQPTKFDSIWCNGKYVPDRACNKNMNGSILPCGPSIVCTGHPSCPTHTLLYSEYIVYDVDQVRISYLVELELRKSP